MMRLFFCSPVFLLLLWAVVSGVVSHAGVDAISPVIFVILAVFSIGKGSVQYRKGEAYRQLSMINICVGCIVLASVLPKIAQSIF